MNIEVVGLAAICIGFARGCIQLYETNKSPDTPKVSTNACILGILSGLIWIAYGIVKHVPSVVLASASGLFFELYFLYKIRKSKDPYRV